MGQYKFWITIGFRFGLLVEWCRGESITFDMLCFRFGVGLTTDAKGFDFWIAP